MKVSAFQKRCKRPTCSRVSQKRFLQFQERKVNPVNEQTHSLWRDLIVDVLVSNKRGLRCAGPRCRGLPRPRGGALGAGSIAQAFLLRPAFAGRLRVPGQVWRRCHGAGDGPGPRPYVRLPARRLRGPLRSAAGDKPTFSRGSGSHVQSAANRPGADLTSWFLRLLGLASRFFGCFCQRHGSRFFF